MRLVAQCGLVLLIAVSVMAWGTSPCLYTNLVSRMANGGAGCCCECCCEEDGNQSGGEDCPACGSVGNMHELPPVGDPVRLDPPVVDIDGVASDTLPAGVKRVGQLDATAGRAPPLVAYRETVSLQR